MNAKLIYGVLALTFGVAGASAVITVFFGNIAPALTFNLFVTTFVAAFLTAWASTLIKWPASILYAVVKLVLGVMVFSIPVAITAFTLDLTLFTVFVLDIVIFYVASYLLLKSQPVAQRIT